jgi:class III poly(R)-hydroxyalkanoic acid synthase PhaE subunit
MRAMLQEACMSDTPQNEFENMARRYWQVWGDAMKPGAPTPGVPGWNEAMQWWTQLAQGMPASPTKEAGAAGWLALMQQLATRFAGSDASATDIAAEWRRLLGANPLPDMLRAWRLQGQQGLDAWFDAIAPLRDAWQREVGAWLNLPAFGIAREHQERWQRLAQAQLALREHEDTFNRMLLRVGERAYELFEQKLAAHAQPGKQLTTARALFDLWIDAAEEAYAETALSPEFRTAWAALVNAQMQLRAGVQKEVEFASGLFGMPTRGEMDAAHRKIAELERALRRMLARFGESGASAEAPSPRASGPAKSKSATGASSASSAKKRAPSSRKPGQGGTSR